MMLAQKRIFVNNLLAYLKPMKKHFADDPSPYKDFFDLENLKSYESEEYVYTHRSIYCNRIQFELLQSLHH